MFGVAETIIGLTLLLFFVCGAAWSTNRRIPLVATAVIVGAYLVFVGGMGVWAARCWECGHGTDATRGYSFVWSLVFVSIIPAVLVGTVLIGVTARLFVDRVLGIRSFGQSAR